MLIATLKRGETALCKSVSIIIINMFTNPLIGKKTILIRCHNSYSDIFSQPRKRLHIGKTKKTICISFYVKAVLRLTSPILRNLFNKGVETSSAKFSTTGVLG